MNAAQPFMLMVVQTGSTNLETRLSTLRLSSAEAIVTGRVPADDLENRATIRAGNMPLATLRGLRPRITRRSGRTMNIWMRFEPTTTVK